MNRLLIIIFIFTSLVNASCGQNSNRSKTKETVIESSFLKTISDTTGLENEEISSLEYKIHFPAKPLGWTSDFENIYSSEQIHEFDSLLSNFEKETSNEIAIVTIKASWTTVNQFDSLILTIANEWGVGKKDLKNGIVIGISSELRKIRICNGYGIESKLSDAETKRIIDETIIPEFRKGEYFEGTKKGLLALMNKIQ